jgi:hypothetical protein
MLIIAELARLGTSLMIRRPSVFLVVVTTTIVQHALERNALNAKSVIVLCSVSVPKIGFAEEQI